MDDIRFGVNIHAADDGFAAHARELEGLGFDTIYLPDHLGVPAPFPALAAIAAATERVRVGTYVLNVGFHNAVLLAREAATVDRLSGGRLVLGIGAGHMKSEFDMAGLPFEPFERRLAKLVDVVDDLDELLSSPDHAPQAVQRPRPPLLIGGVGDGVVTIAAQRADIYGLSGMRQLPGRPPGTFRLITAEETDERVAFFRAQAGPRAADVAIDMLVQRVEITDDREAAAAKLAADLDGTLTPEQALETPYLLLGTPEEIAEQIRARRERWGIDAVTVHHWAYEEMAKVIATMR